MLAANCVRESSRSLLLLRCPEVSTCCGITFLFASLVGLDIASAADDKAQAKSMVVRSNFVFMAQSSLLI